MVFRQIIRSGDERHEFVVVENTVNPRPIARGSRFDWDRGITETADPLGEERYHNVATIGVDSSGLREIGGHDRTTGT